MTKDKKETKPKAPQKKVEKKQAVKKAVITPMAYIDDFIAIAADIYELGAMQKAGFKAYMTGKHYLSSVEAFKPYLEKYLGK